MQNEFSRDCSRIRTINYTRRKCVPFLQAGNFLSHRKRKMERGETKPTIDNYAED
jgi:hypothetical protein